jgi:sugar lactone lactonase YvrE
MLSLLVLGHLDTDKAAEVQAHLAECDYCQWRLREYEILQGALNRHFGPEQAQLAPSATSVTRKGPRRRTAPPLFTPEEIMHAADQEDYDTPSTSSPPTPSLPTQTPRRVTLTSFGALAAVLLLAFLAASLFAYFRTHVGGPGTTSLPVGRLGSTYPVGHPDDVIASATAIWVLDSTEQGMLYRFDPRSKAVAARIPVGLTSGSDRESLAVSDSSVWVAYSTEGELMRIDAQTNQLVTTYHFAPNQLGSITVSPEAVWAAETGANTLLRIDPTTGNVVATVSVSNTPTSLAYGAGAVWACGAHGGAAGLMRVDPQTNQVVAQTDVGESQGYTCAWAQAQNNALWVVALDTHTQRTDILERIDAATNQVVATLQAPGSIQTPMAIGGQDVWAGVGAESDCSVMRVDGQANQIKGTLQASGCQGMLQSAGSIWLVIGPSGSITAVTPAP